MPNDLGSLIRLYAEMVENLSDYLDEEAELVELFIRRELIEDALRAGAEFSTTERERLRAADATLVRRRRRILRRFPKLFAERSADVPRLYWWWYLDEGPQVRGEALVGARGHE